MHLQYEYCKKQELIIKNVNKRLLYDTMPTNTIFYNQLQQFYYIQQQMAQHKQQQLQKAGQKPYNKQNNYLYPPGYIIHFVKTKDKKNVIMNKRCNNICKSCLCCCCQCC